MATEQSFSIALLLTIAGLFWRTMRQDMKEKDERIKVLESDFRFCIQKQQADATRNMLEQQGKYELMMKQQTELMEHSTDVIEQNTRVLQQLMIQAKTLLPI